MRQQKIYYASLADEAQRYGDMIEYMGWIVQKSVKKQKDLSNDEKNLFNIGYKNLITQKRRQHRIILEKIYQFQEEEKDDESEENQMKMGLMNITKDKIESEICEICDKILETVDLLQEFSKTSESRVFYSKLRADFQRYLADASYTDHYQSKVQKAKENYETAIRDAEGLFTTHPLRLATALNYSVFMFDNLKQPAKAVELAKSAFDMALFDLETVEEEMIQETLRVMQLLRDNVTLWEADLKYDEMQVQNQIDEEDRVELRKIIERKHLDEEQRKKNLLHLHNNNVYQEDLIKKDTDNIFL
ncbi:dna damage checkpoint protein rad24 [Stylonychia lemnae]|uniref:Dna damage checkpoint protein rad24 n=1 Tax=Stylonychia lemnae TaxID=5949 RepID=A0A078A3M2_STYLE|nr:dna damage checkpoint protein rad24 [Stylonychia lemnae]|eukprot:CDW76128.1 dna damage checkpoint protein rad24 [Stylonychia lemnae]